MRSVTSLRLGILSSLMLAVVVAVFARGAFAAEPAGKRLLLLGIDGCRFDALQAAKAPRLDALMDGGAVAEPIRIFPERYRVADTVSGPGWSSILTGVWADKHGVLDNEFTAPRYDRHPPFFTLLKQARPEALTVSLSDWDPLAKKIMSSVDDARHFAAREGQENGGADYAAMDIAVTKAAVELLTTKDPVATFVYLGQVDETGHQHGFHPSVPEYVAAIECADALVGEILDALPRRASYANEDWLILVTTDHGGRGTGHGGGHDEPQIARSFLILSGPSVVPGRVEEECGLVDAATTGLAHLGVAIDPKWELDGHVVALKQTVNENASGR
jgi:predicted AlkP superfamily pyrophosphatase or phosphodiesterase